MLQNLYTKETDYIIESKQRCKDLGMNPDIPALPQNIMTEEELKKRREDYEEVLEVVRFFSRKIIKSLEGIPITIGISDEKGYVLDLLSDDSIKETVNKLLIKPGVQYTEEHVGTNVVSLTLDKDRPVQLIGTEHFHTHLHQSACYGVPFHYSDTNELLGTMCIMTGVILHNPFFLTTLTTVVDAIERELLLRKQNLKINEQQKLLYQAEKNRREILEKDLVMKDEFITLMTHEFKTPINVIYSAIQLIEHVYINTIPKNIIRLIESIKRNTLRQLRLVNNLLDITKINSEQFRLDEKKLDIILLTRLITESVSAYAEQKGIGVNFKTDIVSRNIIIDDEKYERILLNLLSNAIKFTVEGGSIKVLMKEDIERKTINISITDTGVGIPEVMFEKIFERFGQVENNLSRQAEGSGIGLALVKMFIVKMGGEIKVDSRVGCGSTFTIILPIKEGEAKRAKEKVDLDGRLINTINVEFSDVYL